MQKQNNSDYGEWRQTKAKTMNQSKKEKQVEKGNGNIKNPKTRAK